MSEYCVKILLVEENCCDAERIRLELSQSKTKFDVCCVPRLSTALEKLSEEEFAVILLDLMLPDNKGLSGVTRIHTLHPEVPIVVLTNLASDEVAMTALARGAQDYLPKQHATSELMTRSIRYAIQRQQNIAIRRRLTELRGKQLELETTNRQLKQSENKFRLFFESAPYAMVIADEDGKIVLVNAQTEKRFGYSREELLGRPVDLLIPLHLREPDHGQRRQYITAPESRSMGTGREVLALRSDGTEFPAEISLSPLETEFGLLIFVAICDVTERKKAEQTIRERDEQLRQSQKLEAVGTLAGSVAHEFNNLLQAITGYTNFAIEGLPPDEQLHQDLQQVLRAAERAADLTRGLLSFSRRQPIKSARVEPNAVIADLLKMLRPLIGEHVELRTDLGESAPAINADATLLQQMLMNLCLNSRDAMPTGGQLFITTEDLVLNDANCECHIDVAPGHYSLISVADTGCGMSPEVQRHIFEPFFTTKEIGKGTGLGMAMVYGVVKQHEGAIHVYSEPGLGTTIKVYLPVADEQLRESHDIENIVVRGGTETILIAEDEPMVRELAARILREAGYTPLTAADGDEAIRVYEANADQIDLALLDMVMPKRFGRDVYLAIKAINPETKVIFCSGYEPDTNCEGFVSSAGLQLIQKPFERDVLLRTIRDTLDQEATCLAHEIAP